MSRVRSRGNKITELGFVRLFRFHRISGWRRNSNLLGKPDFVFRKQRLVLFVDGCFWHVCPKHSRMPAQNRAYWRRKLKRNVERDRLVKLTLRRLGWRVLRVWEHELRSRNKSRLLRRVRRALAFPSCAR